MSSGNYRGSYGTGRARASEASSWAVHHHIARKVGITARAVLVIGVILAIVAGLSTMFWSYEYGSQGTTTFTVQSLDDQSNGSSGHKYLVFTAGGAVYENTDSILHGKTDSSNVWAKFLEAGRGAEWKCPVYGFRNTFFSSYKDILDGCMLLKEGTPIPVT